MPFCLTIIDTDANDAETRRFNLVTDGGSVAAAELLRARIADDLERTDRDAPENHVALVQPLRTIEHGDNIELFTPAVVDLDAQLRAAAAAFDAGDFALTAGGRRLESLDEHVQIQGPLELRFTRYAAIAGG